MDDARAASPASEAGTADELLDRLLQCDAQLVELLRTASRAMLALTDQAPATSSDDEMTQWFATLHVRTAPSSRQDIQITLRHAAHALRQARLPPVLSPAAAQAPAPPALGDGAPHPASSRHSAPAHATIFLIPIVGLPPCPGAASRHDPLRPIVDPPPSFVSLPAA